MNTIRAFEASIHGLDSGFVAATSAGRARIIAARTIAECGYASSVGDALLKLAIRRAPERDTDAISKGSEGWLR